MATPTKADKDRAAGGPGDPMRATRAPRPARWAACSAREFGPVGESAHLVRPGSLDTACGASASHPEIWRTNTTKPRCAECAKKE